MNTKVSVVVPVYRVEQYLQRCVDSLRNQTLRDIEIILVDDGSPDGCPALCDSLAAEDSRIRVIHKQNEGLGMARNTGMAHACGTYIGFVDSDDYVDPDMFECLYETAEQYHADLVMSGARYLGSDGLKTPGAQEQYALAETEVFEGTQGRKKLLLGTAGALPEEAADSRYGFACWKNMYRFKTIQESGVRFVSERVLISEDVIFLLDLIPHISKAVGLPKTFYNYCSNSGSLSKSFREDRFAMTKVLFHEVEARLARSLTPEEYRLYLDRQFQAYCRVICMQAIDYSRRQGERFRETRQRVLEIVNDPELREVLYRYPWRRLPWRQAVFALAMRCRLCCLMIVLTRLRNQ